jgi:hypothetical protein
VQAHEPPAQVQVLQLSSFVSPSLQTGAGHALFEHAQEPPAQVQVLQLSFFVSPSLQVAPGGGQARSVHANEPSTQVQVLHPSSAGRVVPGAHREGAPLSEVAHAFSVQAQVPEVHVQVLQPSSAGADRPFTVQEPPGFTRGSDVGPPALTPPHPEASR